MDRHSNHHVASLSATIYSERFDTKETSVVAEVDVGKLQNWLTRGVIALESDLNPGRGQSRKYATYEVARIRLMKKLADCGVPLSAAFKLTAQLGKSWEQVRGGHEVYNSEPGLTSWLLIVRAADWPVGRGGSVIREEDYAAIWVVNHEDGTSHPNGLRKRLVALGDSAVVVINMGAFLSQTISRLKGVVRDR